MSSKDEIELPYDKDELLPCSCEPSTYAQEDYFVTECPHAKASSKTEGGSYAKWYMSASRRAQPQNVEGVCKSCGGDGIERCDNPDHGILDAMSFRGADESRCPCCGHDEKYRMKHWDANAGKFVWNKCPDCSHPKQEPVGDVKAALEWCNSRILGHEQVEVFAIILEDRI